MKERPILFSGPMVRAIIEGRKTQTRRIVKHREGDLVDPREDALWRVASDGLWHPCVDMLARGTLDPIAPGLRCPYGQPGDRLWVRETSAVLTGAGHRVVYRADGDPEQLHYPGEKVPDVKWKPSIFMSRHESRLTLEATEVRVERLQDISEADAMAEGVHVERGAVGQTVRPGPREHFASLWDSINADRASWASNPWVWCVSFRVAEVRR